MEGTSSFGEWLRRRRRALDLTRDELALQVGCAAATIKKIESDERRPSRQLAERLASCLEIPPADQAAFLKAARAELAVDRLASPPAPPPSPPSPRRPRADPTAPPELRGYTLHEPLGSGGFGTVYRATQPGVGREVAIKVIRPEYANHPDFIRRFEAEAQIVARLEHPHIVPLYDYWREPRGAYLVMRYIRGGSLQTALREGPWPLDRSTRLLDQVANALAFAHDHGVVHRDLKPANILLDKEGNAYLADFGIAKDLDATGEVAQTQTGAIVGSPAYLSPEQLRGEPVTPQSDIYSLGVLLYELLTGAPPFANITPTERLYKQLHEPLLLDKRHSDLLAALTAVIQRATAKQPADRYPHVVSMVVAWQRAVTNDQRPMANDETSNVGAPWSLVRSPSSDMVTLTDISTIENPYKGLRAFGEADAGDFFGRAALTQRLLERLAEEDAEARFLAVVGSSGSGKSSVVRAGLIPALRRGGLPGSEQWFISEMIPGTHPLEELEAALLRIAVHPPESLLGQLREDERGLARAVKRTLPVDEETELVLVIDQFEEVFTLVEDETIRAHLLDSMVAAVLDGRSRLRLVVTLRADFMDRPLQYMAFGDLLRQRTEFVLPLTPEEMERAIAGPAERAGLALEPGLAATIIHEVGEQPGALPLLQYALTELFERSAGRVFTRETYQASGGVTGALARRADEIYASLDEQQQEVARQLFLRLINLGEGTEDTRRRVRLSEMNDWRWEVEGDAPISNPQSPISKVLDRYGRYRLLTFDRDPLTRDPTVEVAHEALIRTWNRLRAWLDATRESLGVQRRLTIVAREWANAGHDSSFLASGARLKQFEALAEASDLALNAEESAYFEASLAERETREVEESIRQRRELDLQKRAANRLRYLVGALTLFLVVAAGLIALTFNQSTIAQRNAAESQNLALVSGSQAALANGNIGHAIALALQAVALDPGSPKAQAALSEAAYAPGTIRRFTIHTGEVSGVVFSPDGRTAISSSWDKTLALWNIPTGQIIRRFEGHTARVTSVVISPDGRSALSGSDDTTLILWEIATGALVRRFEGHTDFVQAVAWSPDGRAALSASNDKTLILWDIQTGEITRRFEGHTADVTSVKFSPDGRMAVSGSGDTTLILWDIQTGQIIHRFEGHIDRVYDVVFSPDGKTVLSGAGGGSGTVILWDITNGQMLRPFYGHASDVHAVAFGPDGRRALSGSIDTTVVMWDVATGQPISRLHGHEGSVDSVAFSPDGRTVLSASDDDTMRLWDLEGGQVIRRFSGLEQRAGRIAVSPIDGGSTALLGLQDGALVLDLQSGQAIRRLPGSNGTHWIIDVAYSPDGRTALLAPEGIVDYPADVVLWNLETGREIRRFVGHQAGVVAVDFSPDGRTAVSGGGKGTIILWDVATGHEIRRFRGYEGNEFGNYVSSTTFSPDGRAILTNFGDGKLVLWDVATGQEIRTFLGHADVSSTAKFTPDGQHIFSGAFDNTAIYWDVATGAIVHRFTDHSAAVFNVQVTPDGRFGLGGSADNTTILWDLQTGQVIRRYTGANAGVFSAAFKPDGRAAVVTFADGSVALWRIDTSLEELVTWTHANRYVPELTCEQQALYQLEPKCAENLAAPTGVITPASS
jgi:WD40 repeat protein/serine/threonine protein kinase/DNA-binding XRE family transcriptional regulator